MSSEENSLSQNLRWGILLSDICKSHPFDYNKVLRLVNSFVEEEEFARKKMIDVLACIAENTEKVFSAALDLLRTTDQDSYIRYIVSNHGPIGTVDELSIIRDAANDMMTAFTVATTSGIILHSLSGFVVPLPLAPRQGNQLAFDAVTRRLVPIGGGVDSYSDSTSPPFPKAYLEEVDGYRILSKQPTDHFHLSVPSILRWIATSIAITKNRTQLVRSAAEYWAAALHWLPPQFASKFYHSDTETSAINLLYFSITGTVAWKNLALISPSWPSAPKLPDDPKGFSSPRRLKRTSRLFILEDVNGRRISPALIGIQINPISSGRKFISDSTLQSIRYIGLDANDLTFFTLLFSRRFPFDYRFKDLMKNGSGVFNLDFNDIENSSFKKLKYLLTIGTKRLTKQASGYNVKRSILSFPLFFGFRKCLGVSTQVSNCANLYQLLSENKGEPGDSSYMAIAKKLLDGINKVKQPSKATSNRHFHDYGILRRAH